MKIGFAAKVLGPDKKGLRVEDMRRPKNNPNLGESIRLAHLALDWVQDAGIDFWRLPSHLAPYGSHPTWKEYWNQPEKFRKEVEEFGTRLKDMRITKHPGQYTLINSPHEHVVKNSFRDLALQAELMDMMNIPVNDGVMILHVGGKYKDAPAAMERFIKNHKQLPENVKARLVIENDDRTWSAQEVYDIVSELGIPMVFDLHHHRCHNPEEIDAQKMLQLAMSTWPVNRTPKVHISSGKTSDTERSHANQISDKDWQLWSGWFDALERDIDVMLEAKDKDWAVLDLAQKIQAGKLFRPKRLIHLPQAPSSIPTKP